MVATIANVNLANVSGVLEVEAKRYERSISGRIVLMGEATARIHFLADPNATLPIRWQPPPSGWLFHFVEEWQVLREGILLIAADTRYLKDG